MSRKTFESIIEIVRQRLQKQNTQLRNAIPIEKRVALAIWRRDTGDSYRAVRNTFGIGKLTAVSITHDFYKELSGISRIFICFPELRSENRSAIQDFKEETNCKIPQTLGAIDCTHYNLEILDFATGFRGSLHDASNLFIARLIARLKTMKSFYIH